MKKEYDFSKGERGIFYHQDMKLKYPYISLWYAANYPELHLKHLESRMIQTGYWEEGKNLTEKIFRELLINRINSFRIDEARKEVQPFVKQPDDLNIWSKDFFTSLVRRIKVI